MNKQKTTNGNSKSTTTEKISFLGSIKGKVLLMGALSILVSVILGMVGLSSLSKNDNNNNLLSRINDISLLQYENQSLETSYLYALDDSYLGDIINNLHTMEEKATQAVDFSSGDQKKDVSNIQTSISEILQNQEKIRSLCTERGFTQDTGSYVNFLQNDAAITSQFDSISSSTWVEGNWTNAYTADTVKIGGKNYTKMVYDNALPQPGKRDYFLVRIGGSGMKYKGTIYISNIVLSGGNKETMNISSIGDYSYGSAFAGIEYEDIFGAPALKINANYTSTDGSWEEIAVKIPFKELNNMDYSHVYFELYFEDTYPAGAAAANTLDGMYNFGGKLAELNAAFGTYSKHVVEGKDIAEESLSVVAILDELIGAVSNYAKDEGQKNAALEGLNAKKSAFTQISKEDEQIFALKKANIQLSQELTTQNELMQDNIAKSTATAKNSLTAMIVGILLASTILLVIITLFINQVINRSIRKFKETLEQITAGNLTVRAVATGKDEFSIFGKSLNVFLDKLVGILHNTQAISQKVANSGEGLSEISTVGSESSYEVERAVNDISNGAVSQASEIEEAAGTMFDMATSFEKIVTNVERLNSITEEMREMAVESSNFMTELAVSNKRTADAFDQVAQQIHITNESVQKIHEAADFITSIASQTSLLSLNASIEAARAGEAGKGFAVVASEIQKLSEQSNSSATNIETIIRELSVEATKTVDIIDTVSGTVNEQQDKLNSTQKQFVNLEHRVQDASKGTNEIKKFTSDCDTARIKVEGVIQNLSAISEENAASTEETMVSMSELNVTIKNLAEEAKLLMESAEEMKNDLKFFNL
ncbi:methyl-accepting chemotaxis protein [Anaerosporobacter sp.]|uniref:methyl-accepting chemotaxis protein n=1 Tax=Anaerosporobacter sp. TaxID=1872529 RepID=UPI00286F0EEB|nr:methyl-accepting chemotaxis protein [Anaerosporobacter sp.]